MRLWAPKATALSYPTSHSLSLSLSLFFFSICSSSEEKAHTHRPLTCTAFFLLSSNSVFFLFFLFCSFCSTPTSHSQTDPHQPKSRDHQRRSSITRQKAPPRARSLIAAIVLILRSSWSVEIGIHSNDGSLLETSGNDSIWKLCCRCRE